MSAAPPLHYLICALPRSGSSVVCDALAATGLAGQPREYFQPAALPKWREALGLPAPLPMRDYLAALRERRATANGVFGAKIMWVDFPAWIGQMQPPGGALSARELLAELLPGLRYVWMRRNDAVRQAISHVRAVQSGQWHRRPDDSRPPPAAEFDFPAIARQVRTIRSQEQAWREFFAAGPKAPSEVTYEEFAAGQEPVIRALLADLGIAAPPPDAPLFQRPLNYLKLSDALSDEWAARFAGQRGAEKL